MTTETARNYGGKPVADRRAERRARFHDAALTVFAEKSYAKASITDLCAAAGLSRRQFYEEYDSREALLVAVYDAVQDDARDAVVAALAAANTQDLRELISAATTAYVGAIGSDVRRAKLAFVEIVGVSEAVEQHRNERRTRWAELIEAAAASALGPDVAPPGGWRFAAVGYIAAVNGLVHEWSGLDPQPPVADLVELLSRFLTAITSD